MGSLIGGLRGGAFLGSVAIANSLSSGPTGILGLATVACSIVTPLTIYKQAYSFSTAYALCVAAMGWTLLGTFDLPTNGPALGLVLCLIAYGLRLGAFLWVREWTVASKRKTIETFEKTPRLQRIPFALSIGLFYSFMVLPALYLCRATATGGGLSSTSLKIAEAGTSLAWFGTIVEGWTDIQKFLAKRGNDETFQGPFSWWFGVSRHPNFFGEILVWLGVLVAGLPAFWQGGSAGALASLLCSLLGISGIVWIMLQATKRLEGKQETNYGGQDSFEEWKSTTSKLVPTKAANGKELVFSCLVSAVLAILARKAAVLALSAAAA